MAGSPAMGGYALLTSGDSSRTEPRMRQKLAIFALATIALSGCGESEPPVMPDLVGYKLDTAKSAIKDVGFTADPEVEGGGMLGIVKESNWTVCEQHPAPGEEIVVPPTLVVDRECGGNAPTATESPAEEPAIDRTDLATPAPSTPSASPTSDPVLTMETNADLAALMALTDYCSPEVAAFAEKYAGEVIAFDGNLGALTPYEDKKTRFSLLLGVGDFSETSQPGPAFQYRDVNLVSDPQWVGNVPDSIRAGQNFRFTSRVKAYEEASCLFLLEPVTTETR